MVAQRSNSEPPSHASPMLWPELDNLPCGVYDHDPGRFTTLLRLSYLPWVRDILFILLFIQFRSCSASPSVVSLVVWSVCNLTLVSPHFPRFWSSPVRERLGQVHSECCSHVFPRTSSTQISVRHAVDTS